MKKEDCKIGTRIVSYGSMGIIRGIIRGIDHYGKIIFVGEEDNKHYRSYPQQLRKLVLKKAEYIWVPNFDNVKGLLTQLNCFTNNSYGGVKFKRMK